MPIDINVSALPVTFRQITDNDYQLIFNSYLRSLRATVDTNLVPDRQFFAYYHNQMNTWLEDIKSGGDSIGLMAVNPDDSNHILGYAIAGTAHLVRRTPVALPGLTTLTVEVPVLNYVYTKQAYRKQGLGSTLVNAVLFSHYDPDRLESDKTNTYIPVLGYSTYTQAGAQLLTHIQHQFIHYSASNVHNLELIYMPGNK